VATKVVEPAVPLPSAGADNSGVERAVAEMVTPQVVLEPHVEATSGGDNVVMVSAEQAAPPPPPFGDHEAVASAATETLVPATALAGGGAAEVSASGALSTIIFVVIDPDTTELPRTGTSTRLCWSACWPTRWSQKLRFSSPQRLRPRPLLKWRRLPAENHVRRHRGGETNAELGWRCRRSCAPSRVGGG
jgi:hypothetical protein